jgi:hypothetical protein
MTEKRMWPRAEAATANADLSLVERAVYPTLIVVAAWGVIAPIAVGLGTRFATLAAAVPLLMVLFLGASGAWIHRARAARSDLGESQRQALVLLLLIALAGSFISFSVHLPRADDVSYLIYPVHFAENPQARLDELGVDLALAESPPPRPLQILYTIDLLWAALAWWFGTMPIKIYHFLVPAVVGGLIPAAWYVALRRLGATAGAAVCGVAAICAFLLIDGATRQSLGNFAFVRAWHGKVILASVVLPLFIAWAPAFLAQAGARPWVRVLLLLAAGSCLTPSSLPMLVLLGAGIAVGWTLAQKPDGLRTAAGRLLGLALAYSPLAALALFVMVRLPPELGTMSAHPTSFWGQLALVFGQWPSFSGTVFVLSAALCVTLASTPMRRFLLGWTCALILLAANPWVFEPVSRYVTSVDVYWRTFFLFPFPLVIGLSVAYAIDRASASATMVRGTVLSLMGVALLLNIAPSAMDAAGFPLGYRRATLAGRLRTTIENRSTFGETTRAGLAPFSLKINPRVLAESQTIIQHLSPGPTLAPLRYSTIIPMLTARYPQVSVRGTGLDFLRLQPGQEEIAAAQQAAVAFIEGRGRGSRREFEGLLDNPGLRNVVLRKDIDVFAEAKASLTGREFRPVFSTDRFEIFSR